MTSDGGMEPSMQPVVAFFVLAMVTLNGGAVFILHTRPGRPPLEDEMEDTMFVQPDGTTSWAHQSGASVAITLTTTVADASETTFWEPTRAGGKHFQRFLDVLPLAAAYHHRQRRRHCRLHLIISAPPHCPHNRTARTARTAGLTLGAAAAAGSRAAVERLAAAGHLEPLFPEGRGAQHARLYLSWSDTTAQRVDAISAEILGRAEGGQKRRRE